MNHVRLGVIGMGNIGRQHADYLLKGKVPRCNLTALCSSTARQLEQYKAIPVFERSRDFFESGLVDGVIIATPHFQHPDLGIAAFEAGLHVMMEKPIAAHKADAERLIAAHQQYSKLKFAAMFQLRAEPRYQAIRKLIQSGEIGEIVRLNWIITDWYRTENYYESSDWRASWQGEGGGVLLNQCLHNLDMLSWLLGQPARVRGFCKLGRYHNIEVEDDATAYLEFPNGATAVLITTTGEAPGTNRLEITGTGGKLVLEADELVLVKNELSMIEFNRISESGFEKPKSKLQKRSVKSAPQPHAALTEDFVSAILDQTPLMAPGEEGLNSVELANAILYSSLTEQTVGLPLDGAVYERKLQELIKNSKPHTPCPPAGNKEVGITSGQ